MKKLLNNSSYFRISFVLCLFFTNVAFLQIPAYVALIPLAVWGVYLTARNILRFQAYKKMNFALWAFGFVGVNLLTALVHIFDNFLINILIFIMTCICFFVFYGIYLEGNASVKHEIYTVARILLYTVTLMQVFGMGCLMLKISYHNEWMDLIVYENRYTGLFVNPNLSGFASVVVVFFIHILYKHKFTSKKEELSNISRIWLISGLFINILTLFLCDSNASLVLFLGYMIVFVLTRFISSREDFDRKQLIVRFFATVLAGAMIIVCTFFMRNICQMGMSALISQSSQIVIPGEENVFITVEPEEAVTFEHENTNVDSGRFTLWKQAMTIFSHYPIIGIGKGNLLKYSYYFIDEGMHFANLYSGDFSGMFASFTTDIHNAYITILVCSGSVGFLLFMIFAFRNGFCITKFLFDAKKSLDDDIFPCLFSFTVAYLGYACFEKAILNDISFMTIFFWFILGQMMCYGIAGINRQNTDKLSFKEKALDLM